MALNLFKLHKLKINVYKERSRDFPQDTFTVMFNPSSIFMRHENKFQKLQGTNTSGRRAIYSRSQSDKLNLELILDGTGVTDYGLTTLLGFGTATVSEQIDTFLKLCFHMDGAIHEPNFLKIQWGDGVLQDFDCRLESVDIKYTSFDKNGAPLRATLKPVFIEDLESSKRLKLEGKSSPDLTHTRIVKSGDTLPMLAKEIYGSSKYYLQLAQVNNIDDFRNLTPGQSLFFPPLER